MKFSLLRQIILFIGRFLHMLSLLLGSRITDAAIASIVQSYSSLELLDLSGYYIYLSSFAPI
jgi:hypothetical protein